MDWNLFFSFLTSANEVRILLSPEMFHSHMFLSASTFSAAQHVGIIKIWHWLLVLMHLLVLEKPGYSSSSFLFLSLSWPPIPFPQRCYAAHAAHAAHALTHTHTHTYTYLLGSDYKAFAMEGKCPSGQLCVSWCSGCLSRPFRSTIQL